MERRWWGGWVGWRVVEWERVSESKTVQYGGDNVRNHVPVLLLWHPMDGTTTHYTQYCYTLYTVHYTSSPINSTGT
jgi:hypothetical protein